MKSFTSIALTLSALLISVGMAGAETPSTPAITIKAPWLRATPNGAQVAGGYAQVTNSGATADRLVAATLPIAPTGEIHNMTMKDGIMHMERLDKGLDIAPGATVTLQPSGYHMMFMKPTAPLKQGQSIAGTMVFEKAGSIPVTFLVGGMGAKTAPGTASHDAGGMEGMDMNHMDMKH